MYHSWFNAFRAMARVAAFCLRPAGAIPANTGSWNTCVGLRQLDMVRRELLMATSTLLMCRLLLQTGARYSAANNIKVRVEIYSVLAEAPRIIPTRRRMVETLDVTLPATSSRCYLKFSIRTMRTPRYFGACWNRRLLSTNTFSSRLWLLCYWDGRRPKLSWIH